MSFVGVLDVDGAHFRRIGENAPVSSIELEGIAKHWGEARALDGIAFSAPAGSFVAWSCWGHRAAARAPPFA